MMFHDLLVNPSGLPKDEQSNAVTPLYSLDAEFSKPMWIFGVSSYDFLGIDDTSHKIVCCYRQNGKSYVGVLDHNSESFSKIDIPFSSVTNIVALAGTVFVSVSGRGLRRPREARALDRSLEEQAAASSIRASQTRTRSGLRGATTCGEEQSILANSFVGT
ncbi:uncharacterized protein LOC8059731 isoform X2 [Sorghum bicolor]|uniref:Uncharacterized protein n=1 Tax=Sorghum bicolor TaxID=4558 RepID=A0A1B6QAP6_SORBI|nr:uncharacterized protein LOC8059731 isoform X2 [Sorghum bicolor]KXG34999.1 hypothetical protein SORBI_3002G120100 [Sorghum bicolor]|eukprot:XP_002459775.2 uncharacterized protein LOC8059731 isoform X2 [Sorghum bicolor]